MNISEAHDADSRPIIRTLFMEYADSLDFDLCFQSFDAELDELPGAYAPPTGRLLMAVVNQEPAGCVALRNLGNGICEMKRLWVRPQFRGLGIGRQLAEAVIQEARRIGYSVMRLDTIASMTAAIALYRSLGFVEIPPYCGNPIPGAKFMELRLAPSVDRASPPTISRHADGDFVDNSSLKTAAQVRLVENLNEAQVEQLHALYQREWWSEGRSLEDAQWLTDHSDLIFGLIDEGSDRLVGFCRVLTDFLVHATIYDVIVAAEYRQHGLGRRLMDAVVSHPRLQRVRSLWLCCLPEMLAFYEKWGFQLAESDIKWLRRVQQDA